MFIIHKNIYIRIGTISKPCFAAPFCGRLLGHSWVDTGSTKMYNNTSNSNIPLTKIYLSNYMPNVIVNFVENS